MSKHTRMTVDLQVHKTSRTFKRHAIASLGNAQGVGATTQEAVENLKTTIERAFEGSYHPAFLFFRGWFAFIWREPDRWCYNLLDPTEITDVEGVLKQGRTGFAVYDTKEEVIASVRSHLADLAWDGEEETSPLILDPEDQEAFTRKKKIEKRFRALRDAGMDQHEALRQAIHERY